MALEIQRRHSRCPLKVSSCLLFSLVFSSFCLAVDETSALALTDSGPSLTCNYVWDPQRTWTFHRLLTPALSPGRFGPQKRRGHRWLSREPAPIDLWKDSFFFACKDVFFTQEGREGTAPTVALSFSRSNQHIGIFNSRLPSAFFVPFRFSPSIGRTLHRGSTALYRIKRSSYSPTNPNLLTAALTQTGSKASLFPGHWRKYSSSRLLVSCFPISIGLGNRLSALFSAPLAHHDEEAGLSSSTTSEKTPAALSSTPTQSSSETTPAEVSSGESSTDTPADRPPIETPSANPSTDIHSHTIPREVPSSSTKSEEVPTEENVSFPRIGIFPDFAEALQGLGVTRTTDIQQLAIPAILGGLDTVIGAETGSGKTLGYIIGVVQNILIQKMIHEKKEDAAMMEKEALPIPRHHPYAVIIVPTRELALQVVAWVRRLCRKTTITAQLMLGTYTRWPFGTLALPTSPDLVVCTPSVLAPFARGTKTKSLGPFREIQVVVLDEADMLLDGGYRESMDAIFTAFRKADQQLAREKRRRTQYIFAAATIPDRGPKSVRKTITSLCPKATFFYTRSLHQHKEQLAQEFIEVPPGASEEDRMALLLGKLRELSGNEKVMIFCNTAQTAQRVLKTLEKEIPASRPKLFSSDIDQKDRAFNLGLFSRGKCRVLVCTDAASRGLDIVGVTLVVQYDFALSAVSHLHRVGRVARAGQPGRALNFFSEDQKLLVSIVQEAARDPHSTSVAAAFSRRRSFRKKIKADKENSGLQPSQSEDENAGTGTEAP